MQLPNYPIRLLTFIGKFQRSEPNLFCIIQRISLNISLSHTQHDCARLSENIVNRDLCAFDIFLTS